LIHALRRNVNIKVLLLNNRIYGLTKGQYSPTSEQGKVTKSTPFGSLDYPFNPVSLALGAEASFVARSVDSDRKHLQSVLTAAAAMTRPTRSPGPGWTTATSRTPRSAYSALCRARPTTPSWPPSSRRPARAAKASWPSCWRATTPGKSAEHLRIINGARQPV